MIYIEEKTKTSKLMGLTASTKTTLTKDHSTNREEA